MKPKTVNQRVQDLRDRNRAAGFVLRQVWVHPDDWERVKKYLERLHRWHKGALCVTSKSETAKG